MRNNTIVLLFAVIVCIFSYGMATPYFISCFEPIETGPCKGHEIRFAYNILRDECVQFIYGGCKGNNNNFKNIESCLRECVTPRF
ncbi:hypothetical protein ACFW04_008405 [Cataglyphis niger]